MPHTLVTSPSASARLDRATSWLRRRRPSERVLLLGASVEATHDLTRTVVKRARAAFGWYRYTLARVAAMLAAPSLASQGLIPVGNLALEAICVRVIDTLSKRKALGRFASVADRPGLPRALSRTLQEIRLAGLNSRSLALADLDRIHDAFQDELDRAGFADRALVLKLAAERARDRNVHHPLLGLPMLLLDVPVTFDLERELLASMANRSPDVLVTVPLGDTQALHRLSTALGVPVEHLPHASLQNKTPSSLVRLQEHLFDEVNVEPGAIDEEVVIFSAPGESRECVEIARLALAEARRGIPFDRMAVLLRSPDQYRAHIEDALRRAKIPAYFAQGTLRPDPSGRALLALLACGAENLSAIRFAEYLSLGQVPNALAEGQVADGLPDAQTELPLDDLTNEQEPEIEPENEAPFNRREEGDDEPRRLKREKITKTRRKKKREAALLSSQSTIASGQVPSFKSDDTLDLQGISDDPPVSDRTVDVELAEDEPTARIPRRWERLLNDAAVIGGIERWHKRLSEHENKLRADLNQAREKRDIKRNERMLSDIVALQQFALPLLKMLPDPRDTGVWGEWLTRLSDLTAHALRRPERVLAVLSSLLPMAAVGPVDLNEVRLVLTQRLTQLTVSPGERQACQIFVAPIDAARGRSFDVVFVPGLAEKIFPQKLTEDPILSDAFRRRVVSAFAKDKAKQKLALPAAASHDEDPQAEHGHLETNDDRIAKERLFLRLAVGAAEKRLIVSYPRVDMDQSRPRVPSFYGLELLRAAEGRMPGFGELISRAERVGSARLGWPAPAKPEHAIDAAEHDLALLETLFHLPEDQTVGTARYLLSVNPHLARALRFRARRWIASWTNADGLYKPIAEAREALAKHSFAQRSFSPTALQHFATCPYKFFLYAVHKLSPRKVPRAIEEMSPLERGSLVHDVLYEVLAKLRDTGKLPITTETLEHARAELDRALDAVAARYADDLAPAIERVWADDIASVRADLREWLRRATEEPDWVPIRFELSFGLRERRSRDPGSTEEPVVLDCGIRLRGSIDLVEQSSWGSIRATDYKTGRVRTATDAIVSGGETLQPVLYALALEKLMPEGTEVESGRLYYCTSAGGFTEVPIYLDQRARDAANEVAAIIGDAIEKTALPAMPTEGGCTYCDYRPVCGPYEELRTKKIKRQDVEQRLKLDKLRRLT